MSPGYAGRAGNPTAPGGRAVARWHTAAVTADALERLLRAATDARGRGPLPWAAAPIREAGRVLDLHCGGGAIASELAPGAWVGVDAAGAVDGRAGRLRASGTAVPIRTNGVDAICMILTLPRMAHVDDVFAEVRRVLRPGGTLVVVVPSVTVRSWTELQLARLLRPVRRGPWRNRSGLDGAGWLLAAADFAVLGDDRVPFALPLPDADSVLQAVTDLPAAGLWPDLSVPVREQLTSELIRRAGPGRVLPLPLRRLVARR
jgi:SAM-dependent methyltransferase